jgi:hypothetical protein
MGRVEGKKEAKRDLYMKSELPKCTWKASIWARWRRLWSDCLLAVLTRGGRGQGGGGRRSLRLARIMVRSEREGRCSLFSFTGALSDPRIWRRFLWDEGRGRKSSRSARIWYARPSLSEESSSPCMSPPRYGITCNTHRLKRLSALVWDLHWTCTEIQALSWFCLNFCNPCRDRQ